MAHTHIHHHTSTLQDITPRLGPHCLELLTGTLGKLIKPSLHINSYLRAMAVQLAGQLVETAGVLVRPQTGMCVCLPSGCMTHRLA